MFFHPAGEILGTLRAAIAVGPILLSLGVSPTSQAPPRPASALDLSDAASWEAMHDWLGNPTSKYCVSGDAGLRFSVGEPGRGMKWRRLLRQPVSTGAAPFLTVRYRAENLASFGDYFLYIADYSGGVLQREARLIGTESLEDDGAFHVLTVKAPVMLVTTMAIQVQAASSNAYVEVSGISFSLSRPRHQLSEILDIGEGWDERTDFKAVPIRPNASAGSWLEKIGLEQRWFEKEKVTVCGVPFRVVCAEPAILATQLDKPDKVKVEVGCEAEAIYLFLGARFTGEESPSIGKGPLLRVRQVERFIARLDYADGPADLVFPARFPSGKHSITQEPSVYVILPPRRGVIKRLSLIDGMRQGQFMLAGVSIGPRPAIHDDISPEEVEKSALRTLTSIPSDAVSSHNVALVIDADSRQATKVANLLTRTDWLETASPLYEIASEGDVSANLRARPLTTGEVKLTLELTNTSPSPVSVKVTFPLLRGLGPGGDPRELGYCFPRRGAVINTLPANLREPYSGLFPLQFMDIYHPAAGGIYIMTHDTSNTPKFFWLKKESKVDLGVEYWPTTLGPKESWTLPAAVIGAHSGDWHAALRAYREWKSTWYRPLVGRKRWFREVFNFRQLFLHFKLPSASGAFDARTKEFALRKVIEADIAAFGGVDYLHIFDWGWTPTHGRCGDYAPWGYLGGVGRFRREIEMVKAAGVPVGLYIEGYLIDPSSDIAKAHGKEWQLLKTDGKPYTNFAPSLNMCSHVPAWQDYLTQTYARVSQETGADGFYIDEFGFGAWYVCHNPGHGHPVPVSPLKGEETLTRKVRLALPPGSVVYTEETPTDVTTQLQDGSFTYAISSAPDTLSPTHINLTRFALPDFKTFEIIVCDKPLRDDQEAVKRVFFNGEGIWLEGIAEEWFTPEVRALIARTHRILRGHRDAFCTLDPTPLVPTRHPQLYANRFPSEEKVVWTLYSTAFTTLRGELLEVSHRPGAEYYDAWHEKSLSPRIVADKALLQLEVGPRDVGCVVQRFCAQAKEADCPASPKSQ